MTDINHSQILPQFVSYYRELGVENLWITFHLGTVYSESAANRARQLCFELGLEELPFAIGEYDAFFAQRHLEALRLERCESDDWIVWADLDEFHQFPYDLPLFLEKQHALGVTAIEGHMLDRISRSGELIKTDPSISLWVQFPVACNITQVVLRGYTRKVAAALAEYRIGLGHHELVEPRDQAKWSQHVIPVHHFKWDATVISRLSPRVSERWRRDIPWWVETDRFLSFINVRGRLEHCSLQIFDLGESGRRAYDDLEFMEFLCKIYLSKKAIT